MRANPKPAEAKLWAVLRDRRTRTQSSPARRPSVASSPTLRPRLAISLSTSMGIHLRAKSSMTPRAQNSSNDRVIGWSGSPTAT